MHLQLVCQNKTADVRWQTFPHENVTPE